jgi:hypothetical protein
LLEQTGGVQTQFWGQLLGQKQGHTTLLEQIGGVQTQFLGQISSQKTGHINMLEQTGGVQTQFWGEMWGQINRVHYLARANSWVSDTVLGSDLGPKHWAH